MLARSKVALWPLRGGGSVTEQGVRDALKGQPIARRVKGPDVARMATEQKHPAQSQSRLANAQPFISHMFHQRSENYSGNLSQRNDEPRSAWPVFHSNQQLAPTPWGTQHHAHAVRRPRMPPLETSVHTAANVFEPEAEEVVATVQLAEGFTVEVRVGDYVKAGEAGVCVWVDGAGAPRDAASTYLVEVGGEELAGMMEEHARLFGQVPKGYVGNTPSAGGMGQELVLHCNPPEWLGGHYHEARWLAMTAQHVLEEAAFNKLPSVALRGRVVDWPLAMSAPLLSRTLRNWADGEHTHGTSVASVAVYFEAKVDAEAFVTLAML
eukprot:TRINITY_DN20130_c0_g1_i1.p2 TRINITY_DN20130_c0_g1~~TRINITY_DN20130_c0_g1_i1.p2  ORF type:complete len:341 (+),score=105.19 TRINITY_DN20130_c0_g1_i1:56-1024(+)